MARRGNSPSEREARELKSVSEAAIAEYLRRSSITFLECAINLMASHMTMEEVAVILRAEAEQIEQFG